MYPITLLLFVFLGCIFASFIPCYAERRQLGLSQWGRSYCQICGKAIAIYDLIPIAGYFIAHGHCRHCSAPIPKRYPVFEACGGILGLMIGTATSSLVHSFLLFGAIAMLFLLSLDDAATQTISDSDLLIYALFLLADSFLYGDHIWLLHGIGALIIALPLFIITRIRPGALGSGDVVFMAITGFYLGAVDICYAFLIGILTALIYATYLLIFKQATSKTAFALIPFLSAGVGIIMLTRSIPFSF